MVIDTLTKIAIYGATTSALYALLAIGLALIFSTAGVLNFAHGGFLTLGAYAVFLLGSMDLPIYVAFLGSMLLTAGFAVVLYLTMVRPVEEDPFIYVIGLLVVTFIMEELIVHFVAEQSRSVPHLIAGNVTVLSVTITWGRVLSFVLSWAFIIGVWYFAFRTTTGQSVMAMSMDEKGAATIGIDTSRLKLLVWGISGALAGIAGYFFGALTNLTPHMGFDPLMIGLVIIVVGGMGSIKGALIAAYLIGILEQATVFLIDPAAYGIVSLSVVAVVLLVRPKGLFQVRELDTEF